MCSFREIIITKKILSSILRESCVQLIDNETWASVIKYMTLLWASLVVGDCGVWRRSHVVGPVSVSLSQSLSLTLNFFLCLYTMSWVLSRSLKAHHTARETTPTNPPHAKYRQCDARLDRSQLEHITRDGCCVGVVFVSTLNANIHKD